MNNNLYNNPNFMPNQNMINYNSYQQNYVEDYLKRNINHQIEAHVSFSDSIEWRDSVFTGILEDVGKDYIVILNNQKKYVIWSVYINYIILGNQQV